MASELSRVQRLAARVMWLDRHRRTTAVLIAAVVSIIMLRSVADTLGVDWPRIHITMIGCVLGVAVWWLTELVLVWLTALWETECAQLIRDRGLPRAIVRK